MVEVAIMPARGVTTITNGRSGLASNSPKAGIAHPSMRPRGTEVASPGQLSGW